MQGSGGRMSDHFICCQCNLNCQKSRQSIIDMGLDPDSDDDWDRAVFCPNWGELAIFEVDDE